MSVQNKLCRICLLILAVWSPYVSCFVNTKGSRSSTRTQRRSRSALRTAGNTPTTARNEPKSTAKQQRRKTKGKNNNNRNNNNNRPSGEKRQRGMDPRIAKSIQVNKAIIRCETAKEVLALLAATPGTLTKMAGGGSLNNVNFCTALHRISRYLSYNYKERASVLSDPRYALLLCATVESFVGMDFAEPLSALRRGIPSPESNNTIRFENREMSSLAWSLAKVRVLPPKSAMPFQGNTETAVKEMMGLCYELRSQVLEGGSNKAARSLWIPTLSRLSARLFDAVEQRVAQSKNLGAFKSQELANLIWAMSTSRRYDQQVFEDYAPKLLAVWKDDTVKPQEFSNVIWAYATSQIVGAQQQRLFEIIASVMEERPGFVQTFKSQELSNTAWGLATLISFKRGSRAEKEGGYDEEDDAEDAVVVRILRKVVQELTVRPNEFKSQEIANTVWALGTLGFGQGDKAWLGREYREFNFIQTDDVEGDKEVVRLALEAVSDSAQGRLHRFRNQELNNLAWGYAKLGQRDHELFREIATELSKHHRRINGQDIAATLWAFASTEFFDEASFRKLTSRMNINHVHTFNPQELSNVCWAIATAGVEPSYPYAFDTINIRADKLPSMKEISRDPITLFFAAGAQEIMKRPQQFISQEVKDLLWGFSRAGIRHPRLFLSVAEHLVGRATDVVPEGSLHCGRGLHEFSSQGIGNMLWSFARQAQLSAEGPHSRMNGRIGVYSSICRDIGEEVMKRLVNCCAEVELEKYPGLDALSTCDMSNAAWAMATVGINHGRFFSAVENQMMSRVNAFIKGETKTLVQKAMCSFKGQELCNLLWSSATVNRRNTELLDAVTPYAVHMCTDPDTGTVTAASINQYFNQQELGNVGWVCAVMDHYPPDLIRIIYQGVVGIGPQEQNLAYMSQFHGGGLQRQVSMCLLYIEVATQLSGIDCGVQLPKEFLGGWFQLPKHVEMEDSTGVLSLRTSKIQKDVSAAFDRIGFDHEVEHMIPFSDDYDDDTTAAVNFLSLDAAVPSRKWGVEVDGPSHYVYNMEGWSPQSSSLTSHKTRPMEPKNSRIEYEFEWSADTHDMNGSTSLKARLLQQMGWTILHIPFWEWHEMNNNPALEDEYCRKLVAQFQS